MPPGHLLLEVLQARTTGRRPWGRPRTHCRDYISNLVWEDLGIPQEELEIIAVRGRSGLPQQPGSE